MIRKFSFSVLPPLSTPALRNSLATASDKSTERTGIQHSYRPVDLRDKEACGVTNDGLDSTYNHLRKIGNHPAADRLKKVMEDG